VLSVVGAFAEFERALIRERQREGITLAKQRGPYGGRKKSMGADQVDQLVRRRRRGTEVRTGPRVQHQPPNGLPVPSRSNRPRRIDLSHRSIILALTDCGW